MAEFVSEYISSAVHRTVRRVTVVGHDVELAADHLKRGDALCETRMSPLTHDLVKEVPRIYKRCSSSGDTPLMKASHMGFANMVWGFLECAKQSNTNLHTNKSFDALSFMWLQNEHRQTALDIAIANSHVEVAKVILRYASKEQLSAEWISKGDTLLPLLCDPIFDDFVFEMLESQPEAVIDTGSLMGVSSSTHSGRNETPECLLTIKDSYVNDDNILHLASSSGDMELVKQTIKEQPSLICSRNSENETPVYVAARKGHVDILKYMITYLREKNIHVELTLTRPRDNQTALHIAIQNHDAVVVFWLMKEVPQLAHRINRFGESPLYIAAQRKYHAIIKLILNKCEKKVFEGPRGKTALHAAAISNSSGNFDPLKFDFDCDCLNVRQFKLISSCIKIILSIIFCAFQNSTLH